jgi:multicomponent Na+:H+ antiporter subunit E
MTQPAREGKQSAGRACLTVTAAAALAWFLLLGDDLASWIVGAPCVLLCAWYSASVLPARRVRGSLVGWLRLLPYFLWSSLDGGWDVARRVLTPTVAVKPGFFDYTLHIPAGPARNFFVQLIGLLPGTLGARLEGDNLKVHVLNLDADNERSLRSAEERVAAAFAIGEEH